MACGLLWVLAGMGAHVRRSMPAAPSRAGDAMKTEAFCLVVAGSALVLLLAARGGAADWEGGFDHLLEVDATVVSDHELDLQQAKGLADRLVPAVGGSGDWGVILWDELKPGKPGAPQPPPQPSQGQSSLGISQSR